MRPYTRLLAAALATAGCYVSTPVANVLAQSPPSEPSTPVPNPAPNPAPDLSDQKLSAAAAALERVVGLQNDYRQRIAQAEAPAEKERLVAEANNELSKAVTEQGLSVEEYSSILDVARDNPEIRGKILQHIKPSDKPSDK
jgi:Domain of unknown function (DUF4168)